MPCAERQLDRLRRTRLWETLDRWGLLAPLLRAAQAVLVREHVRFVVSELRRRRGAQAYTLRGSNVSIVVRHGAGGAIVLNEIFRQRVYEPPADAMAVLPAASAQIQIADLGANTGMYGSWCLQRWPRAEIVSFEPDPANSRACRRAICRNRAATHWRLVEACAGTSAGEVFFAGDLGTASHVVARKRAGTRLVPQIDAFEWIADSNLIKIDIEGSEWALLEDARMVNLAADAIVVEYHGGSSESEAPIDRCRRLLRRAGYAGFSTDATAEQDQGVVWSWRIRNCESPEIARRLVG